MRLPLLGVLVVGLAGCGSSHTGKSRTITEVTTTRTATTLSTVARTTAATSTAQRAVSPPNPKCQPVDLGIHHAFGQASTAMAEDYFQFINVSGRECHLLGYPGVAVYDGAGRMLHVKVSRTNFDARPVREARLRPGGRATFEVQTSAEQGPGEHCVFAARERFTPPNDRGTLSIRHRLMICFGVEIGPVLASTR